jgi:O-antigen/teichoic acid export membrane protein
MKEKIFKNAFVAILQVVVRGATLFILYRFLLVQLGIDKVGVWSVVLATASISRLTELGLTGSVIKFVAKYKALDDPEQVNSVVQTAVVSLAVFLGAVFLLLYFPLALVISHVIPADMLDIALRLLPYSLLSLWISSVAGAYVSALDGCQRNDIRGMVMMTAGIMHLVMAVLLTPRYGLLGLAYAQVIQAVVVMIFSADMLKLELPRMILLPTGWRWETCREMLSYGITFQVGSLAMMLFDPVTKMLLSSFGDLAMVGYFEMANRMVQQFRAILIAANHVLVPVIAGMYEDDISKTFAMYKKSFGVILFVSFPLYGSLTVFVPLISVLWLGSYQPFFVNVSFVLIAGWLLNTLIAPAYFANLGIGSIKWNTLGQVLMGVLNAVLGPLLGFLAGGAGVVCAYLLALVTGSGLTVYKFHSLNTIRARDLISRPDRTMIVVNLLGLVIFSTYLLTAFRPQDPIFRSGAVLSLIVCLFFLLPAWYHPLRGKMFQVLAAGRNRGAGG